MRDSHRHAVAVCLALLLLRAAGAQGLPAVQEMNGVSYLSGGIGLEESTAIRAESPRWPLTLLFAVQRRQRAVYAADVRVRILDARGAVRLEAVSDGPYMLVRLPPGSYTVEATHAGRTQRRAIQLQEGKAVKAGWTWPEAAGETGS